MRKTEKRILNILIILMLSTLMPSVARGTVAPYADKEMSTPLTEPYVEDGDGELLYLMGYADYDKAYEVLDSINRERRKRGIATLSMDQDLMEAAMTRAAETVLYFEHARPNGSKWNSVSSKVNGENLGKGTGNASRIMSLWMKSAGHRENVLRSRFRSVGVACFECNGVTYWVQLYGHGGSSGAEKPENGNISVGIDLPEGGGFTPEFEITDGIGGEAMADAGAAAEAEEEGAEKAAIRMFEGEKIGLGLSGGGLTFDPAKLSWTVSDPELASIDDSGEMTITGSGELTVTAATATTQRASVKIATKKHIKDSYILDSFAKTQAITGRKYLDYPVCPALTLLGEDGPLKEGEDYSVNYRNNEAAGTGEIEIRGIGEYGGIATRNFEIQ